MKYRLLRSLTISLIPALIGISTVHSAELKDGVTHLDQTEFQEKVIQVDSVVIDIRTDDEYKAGHIKGAKHVPLDDILSNGSLLDEYVDKDIIFYCQSGARVKHLTSHLQAINHSNQNRLFHLKGDMKEWAVEGLPIEK